jgi:peptide/nickel transport system permease protein
MPESAIEDPSKQIATAEAVGTGQSAVTGRRSEREFTVRSRSQTEMVVRRFLQHKAAVVSLVVFVLLFVFAFLVPVFWKYGVTDRDVTAFSQAPSLKHPFGTDNLGHDEMALVMRGTERSIEIALFVAIVSTTIGTVWGAIAGFYRGWADSIMMRFADLVLTIPLLAIAAVLGHEYGSRANGWLYIAIVLALLVWAPISRVIRGVCLSLREKEFIEAARALGASDRRIIFRHLLPNALGPVIVNVTIYVAVAILLETALSFLGFGVQAPDTSLGVLVSVSQTAATTRPWLFYFPGLFIILIALSINFIGDGLRDAFDPTQTRVRA